MKKHNLFFIVGLFTACLLLGGCSLKTLDEKAASVTGTEKEAVETTPGQTETGTSEEKAVTTMSDDELKNGLKSLEELPSDALDSIENELAN